MTKRRRTTLAAAALLGSLASLGACGQDDDPSPHSQKLTFWQDVAPILNDKCVRCHQAGGIAPFALDDFADAKARAALIKAETQAGTMPPYLETHDGSCGQFHDETTLTSAQKDTIARWVDGGAAEGTPVTLTLPPQDHLADVTAVATPTFAPVAEGSALAAHDEYRCFVLDAPAGSSGFLTAYEVRPGTPAIVHHLLGFVIDPAKKTQGGITNAAMMTRLHEAAVAAEGKERDGWPCFGGAGDGLEVESVPITWAPGQGVVNYPTGMGAPFAAGNKIVVQMHYNLEDPASAGLTDRSTIVLHFEPTVTRSLAFVLNDPFLDSLNDPTPDSLPPGLPNAQYKWSSSLRDLGLGGQGADLVGIMPHMHGRGRKQNVRLGAAGAGACISDVQRWDFHWQEMYFYKERVALHPSDRLDVTCEYDTSADTSPVLPGWGTGNEMCLPILVVALPAR